jgi:hypothetical protein
VFEARRSEKKLYEPCELPPVPPNTDRAMLLTAIWHSSSLFGVKDRLEIVSQSNVASVVVQSDLKNSGVMASFSLCSIRSTL